jgi:hypothetical protein
MKAPVPVLAALLFCCPSTAVPAQAAKCHLIYAPVCALGKDGKRATLGNVCYAESAGARVLHKGKCEGGDVCSMIYMPVCATDPASGAEKTYSSLCVAEHANATLVHDGACAS